MYNKFVADMEKMKQDAQESKEKMTAVSVIVEMLHFIVFVIVLVWAIRSVVMEDTWMVVLSFIALALIGVSAFIMYRTANAIKSTNEREVNLYGLLQQLAEIPEVADYLTNKITDVKDNTVTQISKI